jgi:hypothetical protein
MLVTCRVAQEAFGFAQCCGTCHYDADEGYDAMCGDRINFDVCCSVGKFLADKGIDIYEPVSHPELLKVLNQKNYEDTVDV